MIFIVIVPSVSFVSPTVTFTLTLAVSPIVLFTTSITFITASPAVTGMSSSVVSSLPL